MGDPADPELSRVRAAYQRRAGADHRYAWSNPAYQYTLLQLERAVLRALGPEELNALPERRILEVGCGTGFWLRQLVQWGARPGRVVGIDLLPERVAQARRSTAAGTGLLLGSATDLPFRDGGFDLVLQATVFTSMLDDRVRRAAAAEMRRVLAPGGAILWYDYFRNNPRNPDVRAVTAAELAALFPEMAVERTRVTLAPPITRLVAPRSWLACRLLEQLPWLRTHYLAVLRPAPRGSGR